MNEQTSSLHGVPVAWLYQVRFTGENGRQETGWHNYGVYLGQREVERGMKHAGAGLGCRVVPLFAIDPGSQQAGRMDELSAVRAAFSRQEEVLQATRDLWNRDIAAMLSALRSAKREIETCRCEGGDYVLEEIDAAIDLAECRA